MNRRGAAGAVILLLWAAGAGLLAHRELFRDDATRMADASRRVAPGTVSYVVEQGGAQVGFASSTVDTTLSGVRIKDVLVAELPVGGRLHRASAESDVRLTHSLALASFDLVVQSETGLLKVAGHIARDTLLLTVRSDAAPPDTQRIPVTGPVLLPTVVPLVVALGGEPQVGKRYAFAIFDPMLMRPRDVALEIRAESLFTVSDSAVLDAPSRRWREVNPDTVRAWQIGSDAGGALSAWVDAQGRVVELRQPGALVLRRGAYDFAAQNWRLDSRAAREGAADDDILESTAIAASAPLGVRRVDRLRVRLRNADLAGFDLAGDRQSVHGDTLTVVREDDGALRPLYALPGDAAFRARFAAELGPEALLQSTHPSIVALARRLAAGSRDPRVVAERLGAWVHDSLAKEITLGVPDALQVLGARRGDCNEHTQLYLALARAAGIPARSAAGLAYVSGKFYYHAWPEVYLGRWVAVDPTFGQFPADAAHLRFVTGGLARQAALLRLIGKLGVDVVGS